MSELSDLLSEAQGRIEDIGLACEAAERALNRAQELADERVDFSDIADTLRDLAATIDGALDDVPDGNTRVEDVDGQADEVKSTISRAVSDLEDLAYTLENK